MLEKFQALGDEGPESGLFFLESRSVPVLATRAVATGMAFLISSRGLLATCSHVPLAAGRVPGTIIKVYGAVLPFSVDALVLTDGWRGPDWTQLAGSEYAGRNLLALVDQRPEMFQEDLAFLQLKIETARWDTMRRMPDGTDARSAFLQAARVLPLGVPGYKHGSSAPLRSWNVAWEAKSPMLCVGDGRFLGVEQRLHGVVRFRSEAISHGFSGAPLWDEARKRVVGMVRRGITRVIPDTVLGVDARVIAQHSGIPVQPDAQAAQLLDVLGRIAAEFAPLRHSALVDSSMPAKLVELQVGVSASRGLLDDHDNRSQAVPALPQLLHLITGNAVTVLSGSAGSGKSTLLWQISEALLCRPIFIGTLRLVPLMIRAVDFEQFGFDIAAILDAAAAKNTYDVGNRSFIDVLALNDLLPLVLLDGLDEVSKAARPTLVARLAAASSALRVARILIATRPIDDLKMQGEGRTRDGWPALELQHLLHADITALSEAWFADAAEFASFNDLLSTVAWDKRGPTPLQITSAARLYRANGGVPERPIDLTFQLIDHLLSEGHDAATAQVKAGSLLRSKSDSFFIPHLRAILRRLSTYNLKGITTYKALCSALSEGNAEPWSADPSELFRFLAREDTELGGLLSLDGVDSPHMVLRWQHRTVTEALAAEDLAEANAYDPLTALAAFQASLRTEGQSFALMLLAAMDRRVACQAGVDLILSRTLDTGSSDYNATLWAIRALGAGIQTNEEQRGRLVRTLIALLLLPDGERLGTMKCSEVFTTDDLPNPLEVARRPMVRGSIVEQLHIRWAARDPRRRGQAPPLYISSREALLLDRLAMWSDIHIPIASRSVSLPVQPARSISARTKRSNTDEPLLSAALLTQALWRLKEDAGGFFADFAQFARGKGSDLTANEVAHAYIAGLLPYGAENHQKDG